MDLHLKNKTALITGSSRGTGSVIAQSLATEGAFVFIQGAGKGDGDEVVASIKSAMGQAHSVHGDIESDDGANQLAEQVRASGKKVDIVINNFGSAQKGSWAKSKADDWMKDYECNVLSAVRVTRLFVDPMKEAGWGRIIQIGSTGSTRPNARMPGYYAAKAALAASTVSLAKELAQTGITVNTVSPGLILTPEVEKHFLEMGRKKGWGQTWDDVEPHVVRNYTDNPTGKIARREDVASLVAFLASPLSGHINGQNIRIDGGAVDIV